jgi:hypothetical protein
MILALLTGSTGAAAQQFHGELRSGPGGAALGGALVTLLDGNGRVVHAALTNPAGRFRLTGFAPGVYRLQAELIGHRTTTTDTLRVAAGEVVTVALDMAVQPIALAALEITGANACRVRPQEGMVAHTLWEQAAKALRAAAVLQQHELIEYTVTTYEREVSLSSGRAHTEQHAPRRVTGRPFAALTAGELAEAGWVHEQDGEVLYHGPDAHVLLADAFLDTHCMRAERRDAERSGLIGIAFEPVPGRSVPDVRGVLWLDEQSGELQHLAYTYTGLEGRRIAEGTGRVEFARLENGMWVVRRWWIRMHRVVLDRSGRQRAVAQGYLEMGGEITEITRRDDG